MSEVRRVVEFPEYEVNEEGDISRNGKLITAQVRGGGYLWVRLYRGNKVHPRSVHSIVCAAFHGPKPTPLHEVAHGDGNRTNCHKDNLRWATRVENQADRILHGTTNRGVQNGMSRFTDEEIEKMREMKRSGVRQVDIAERFNTSSGAVSMIVRGLRRGS